MRKKLSKLQNKNIKKIREINLLIKLQINLSVCRTSDYQLLLFQAIVMAAEKMWWKSQSVYPPEMIQTSLLGRLQKKSLEHNECLYVTSALEWSSRKSPTKNVNVLFQCF